MSPEIPPPHRPTWFSRIPESDRHNITAIREWLSPIPWQLFATLTFNRPCGEERALGNFKTFVDTVERELRDVICCVYGIERKPRSVGIEVHWHFHAMMTSNRPIPAQFVETRWRSMYGVGKKTPLHPQGDAAVVLPFEPGKLGIEYCLKQMNTCHGDWDIHRLDRFHPDAPQTQSHKARRQRRRSAVPP